MYCIYTVIICVYVCVVYNQFAQSDRERRVFSLTGPERAAQRTELYKFLLTHMSDEHRFNLTAKLCHEVRCEMMYILYSETCL